MSRSIRWRRCGTLALALSAFAAAPAHAAVTSSSVSAPADGAISEYNEDVPDADPLNLITVSGTSNGTTGDTVDVGCQYLNDTTPRWDVVADDVPVNANGTFSVQGNNNDLFYTCALRAIPGDTPDANRATIDVSPYTGPTVLGGEFKTYADGSRTDDFYIARSQRKGLFDYDSAADCGVDDSNVFTGAVVSDEMFYCNDYFYRNYNTTRNGVQIDGRRAYLPDDADTSAPGAPALTFSRAIDPATGNMTITESDPVAFCTTSATSCPSYAPAGVRLDRVITQNQDGLQTTVSDSWVSTDGQAHSLDLIEEEDFGGSNESFRPDWESSDYTLRSANDIVSAPPGITPATMFIDDDATLPDTDATEPQGAVTYASQPTGFLWYRTDEYFARYRKAIPAAGSVPIVQVYSQSADRATVQAFAAAAVAKYTPAAPAPAPAPAPPAPQVVTQTVNVRVPTPVPQCVIPKLAGLTVTAATTTLRKAKCAVGKVTRHTTSRHRSGRVYAASKQVGGAWKVGQKVDLTVAKKPAKKHHAKKRVSAAR